MARQARRGAFHPASDPRERHWEVLDRILRGLLAPHLGPLGASLLACVMLGAIATYLVLIDGSAFTPPALLGLCVLVIATTRRRSAARSG